MAAAETRDPARTIPRAIRSLTVSIVLLYLGAFSVLILVLPWNQILMGASPFVQALSSLGLTGLQQVLNFVVLTAALSALSSSLFAISRMLRALAKDAEAPRIFLRSSASGNPTWAVAGSSVVLLVAILISYLMPARAFQLLSSASASTAMFSWSIIALCHLKYRPVPAGCGGDGVHADQSRVLAVHPATDTVTATRRHWTQEMDRTRLRPKLKTRFCLSRRETADRFRIIRVYKFLHNLEGGGTR